MVNALGTGVGCVVLDVTIVTACSGIAPVNEGVFSSGSTGVSGSFSSGPTGVSGLLYDSPDLKSLELEELDLLGSKSSEELDSDPDSGFFEFDLSVSESDERCSPWLEAEISLALEASGDFAKTTG